MAKFYKSGSAWIKDVDKALNKGMRRSLVNTQSKLAASSPIDTGRLASSWFVAKGMPSLDQRPENWAEPGDKRLEVKQPEKKTTDITSDGDWFITNNLPYAERAALDPGYVGRRGGGAGDWFTRIESGLVADFERSFKFFLDKTT